MKALCTPHIERIQGANAAEAALCGRIAIRTTNRVAQTYAQMAPVTRYRTFRAVQAILHILERRVPARLLGAACVMTALLAGCDTDENPLAPYEGQRPFIIQTVTQSYSPDLQWVGGRATAVGINRGEAPALDSTLVWMRISASSDISSPLSISDEFDIEEVMSRGGQPTDSLDDGVLYTVWVADEAALNADLDTTVLDEFSLADSTFEAAYFLSGRSGGGVDAEFTVVRNQTLEGDSYVLSWIPSDLTFRQLAIRPASIGGFTDLLWHVIIPEGESGAIESPVVVGETPPGASLVTEWAGWGSGTHTLWATTEDWGGQSFGFNTPGYAFYQMFASNFE